MSKQVLSKSLSRYLVVQATFNQSFGFDKKEIEKQFTRNCDLQFHVDQIVDTKNNRFDKVFFKKIFNNVFEKEEFIILLIKQNLKSSWSLTRLPKILQAILRVAISEMITYPKTSLGTIVTEYMKLAEFFNIDKENGFINAILDKINTKLKSNG